MEKTSAKNHKKLASVIALDDTFFLIGSEQRKTIIKTILIYEKLISAKHNSQYDNELSQCRVAFFCGD